MYGKVFVSLWDGSMRGQSDLQLVFIYLLCQCDNGGFVEVIHRKIADDTGLPLERVQAALHALESPDPESRTPDDDGRRLQRLDDHRAWGWHIVNHEKYRALRSYEDRKTQNREAQQRRRSVSKRQHESAKSAHTDADADADTDANADLERGLSSSLKLSPTPDGDMPDKHIPKEAMAKMIGILARGKGLKAPAADWRPGAWDDARAIAKTPEQAHELMEVAGWLRKRQVSDHVAIARVFRAIVQYGIKNPMAYFTRNGVALNAIIGQRAVERAEHEAAEIRREERAFFAEGEALA